MEAERRTGAHVWSYSLTSRQTTGGSYYMYIWKVCVSASSNCRSSWTRNMLRQRGGMVNRLVFPKLSCKADGHHLWLCHSVKASVVPGEAEAWWTVMKSNKNASECLADSAASLASDQPEKEPKVIGFNKILQQWIILHFWKVEAHKSTRTCTRTCARQTKWDGPDR